jgi:hypothetical protein
VCRLSPPLTFVNTGAYALPDGTVGEAYTSVTVTPMTAASCGSSLGFALTGVLPTNMNFDAMTGAISGTPTMAGSFSFTVHFTGSLDSAKQAYTLKVDPAPACTISPPATPTATAYALASAFQGSMYTSQTLTASAGCGALGAAPWSITSGALPPGLSINANGTITGVPTVTGVFDFTVGVTGSAMSGSQAYSLTVNPSQSANCQLSPPSTPTAAPYALPDGLVGQLYNQQLSWSAGCGTLTPPNDFVVTAGTLPNGLTLYSDGSIRGTPTTATPVGGPTAFTITVTGSTASGSQQYTINIQATRPAAPTGVTANPGGSAGQIALAWSAVAGVTNYQILRANASGAETPPPIATPVGTSYSDTGLTTGQTYYYIVQACINGICSFYSSQVSAVAP